MTLTDEEREGVREWAAGLSDAMLLCRTLGHAPIPSTVTIVTLEGTHGRAYEQTERCRNRCGCEWTTLISMRTGERFSRNIHYPKGYLAKGVGRIYGDKKNIVRLEDVQRRFLKASA